MLATFNFWWMAAFLIPFTALEVEAVVTGEKWCNSVRVIKLFALLTGTCLSYNASYSVSMCYW